MLDAAMRVFWAKGYAATSIEDILQATGLSKPSLYAAFGGKAKLYRTVLGRYVGAVASAEVAALADTGQSAAKALKASLKKTGQRLLRDDAPHGCMIAASILDEEGLNSGTRDDVLDIVRAMEEAFLARSGEPSQRTSRRRHHRRHGRAGPHPARSPVLSRHHDGARGCDRASAV